jgi:hypothetical protein
LTATPPSDPQSAPSKNPCKDIGITANLGHSLEDSTNFSLRASHVEEFGENDEKVPQVPQDEIIPPSAGEVDGAKFIYTDEKGE